MLSLHRQFTEDRHILAALIGSLKPTLTYRGYTVETVDFVKPILDEILNGLLNLDDFKMFTLIYYRKWLLIEATICPERQEDSLAADIDIYKRLDAFPYWRCWYERGID